MSKKSEHSEDIAPEAVEDFQAPVSVSPREAIKALSIRKLKLLKEGKRATKERIMLFGEEWTIAGLNFIFERYVTFIESDLLAIPEFVRDQFTTRLDALPVHRPLSVLSFRLFAGISRTDYEALKDSDDTEGAISLIEDFIESWITEGEQLSLFKPTKAKTATKGSFKSEPITGTRIINTPVKNGANDKHKR